MIPVFGGEDYPRPAQASRTQDVPVPAPDEPRAEWEREALAPSRLREVERKAVQATTEEIVAWLWRRHQKWRRTADSAVGDAADVASHWAAAYAAAAEGVQSGEPRKRARMEDMEVGG